MSLQELISKSGNKIEIKPDLNATLTPEEIIECENIILDFHHNNIQSEIRSIDRTTEGILIAFLLTEYTNIQSIAFQLNEACKCIVEEIQVVDQERLHIRFKKPPRFHAWENLFPILASTVGAGVLYFAKFAITGTLDPIIPSSWLRLWI